MGCIAMRGTGCCSGKIYSARMNQNLYINELENELLPAVELLMDGDKDWIFNKIMPHTTNLSSLVLSYFFENSITVLQWPARSPDLSPIEHIWNIIDRKLIGQKLSSLADLELAIAKEWNEIEPSTCANLIESMPKRKELWWPFRILK
jgi:hypothetical protein